MIMSVKGLLLKDFLNLKKLGKQYLMICLGMTVFSVITKNPSFITLYIILCSSMTLISSFAFDESVKFDLYQLSLPVSRQDIVKEKYLLLILLNLLPIIPGTALSMVINGFVNTADWTELISFGVGCGGCLCMIYAVMLPFIFKLGTEKARMIMIGIYVGVFALGYLLVKVLVENDISEEILTPGRGSFMIAGIFAVAVLIILGSYFVSKKILLKKDF